MSVKGLPPLPPLPRKRTHHRPAESDPNEAKDTATFSVRFTDEQRELIAKAAAIRGWSPTNLLRTAALEKAVHIINTASPNQIDFRAVARTVADQVFARRKVLVPVQAPPGHVILEEAQVYEDLNNTEWDPEHNPVEVRPKQQHAEFLEQLRAAARYGGAEFLALVLEASADIATRTQPLPPPIDPNAVQRGESQ
jgi:uncharacterized protein (DUF1778 family)